MTQEPARPDISIRQGFLFFVSFKSEAKNPGVFFVGLFLVSFRAAAAKNPGRLFPRPELWPDPEQFKPERFLESAKPLHLLPLGGGSQRCLNAALPTYQMKTAIAEILCAHS
jgi:Cytochrome P450